MKDYYEIFEVDSDATNEQIKSQYRFLSQAWHPDKFQNSELKEKAEEKIREVNEAYSVIGDSINRENYDRTLRSNSSPSKSSTQPNKTQPNKTQPYTQSRQDPSHSQPQQACKSCGLPTEIKYVDFYENVGMLVMRQRKSISGYLCKSCIEYYFWNLTGKTMLLGWWGVISFIVTPFILLNNIVRYIFTLGMKKPPFQIAPSPSPFWVFTTIGGILLI